MEINKELSALKDINSFKAFKCISGLLASLGATAAVIALMRTPLSGSKGLTKILMKVGMFVLACKAGDVAENYVKDTLTEAEAAIIKGSQVIKEASENV